jgi:hypothetical protein
MVNDEIWIPTPDELDAEAEAEDERRRARRGGRRSGAAERAGGGPAAAGSPVPRRTLRIGGDVTRRQGDDGPGPEGSR